MKAVVKHRRGEGNISVVDREEPSPGKGEVKVRVIFTGICGSDLHVYHDDIKMLLNPPVIVGHEFCGEIVEVGEGVESIVPGERVVAETTFETCGSCILCRTGRYNLCEKRKSIGFYADGAFTDYCIAKVDMVHKLPDDVRWKDAVVAEPLSFCVNGIDFRGRIRGRDTVVVIGPGTIGLLSLQVLKAKGSTVVVVGLSQDESRLSLALDLGADHIIRADKQDVYETVYGVTGGNMAEVVIECSGSAAGISCGIEIVQRGGQLLQFGLSGEPVEVPFELIAYKQLTVRGAFAHTWETWERALKYLETGAVRGEPLISHRFPITEWKRAYEMMENKEGVKILLEPVG